MYNAYFDPQFLGKSAITPNRVAFNNSALFLALSSGCGFYGTLQLMLSHLRFQPKEYTAPQEDTENHTAVNR